MKLKLETLEREKLSAEHAKKYAIEYAGQLNRALNTHIESRKTLIEAMHKLLSQFTSSG